MGSLEDHKGFGSLHPQFWRTRTATGGQERSFDEFTAWNHVAGLCYLLPTGFTETVENSNWILD